MSGLDINFSPNPNNGSLLLLNRSSAIKQRLKTAVKTRFYERKFWPSLGSQVANVLFDNYSRSLTEYIIRKAILNAIIYQEPMVRDVKVVVQYNDADNQITATIDYKEVQENTPQTFDISLGRLR